MIQFIYKVINKMSEYKYILNDNSIKQEKLVVLNDTKVTIDYGNKSETINVKENDSFRLDNNLIYTNKTKNDIYVNDYKSVPINKHIKFICPTNSLIIKDIIEKPQESIMQGEEEKWEIYFDKTFLNQKKLKISR